MIVLEIIVPIVGLIAVWRISSAMKAQAAAQSRLASVMERDLVLRTSNITPAPDACPDYPPEP